MVVEAKKPPMSEVWTQLEGQVVNGSLPLRRYLGSSDHSGVFLTEYSPQNLPHAALKLVPAIPTLAESQLSHWRAAASVAHPQLIRLFETGRCQLGGLQYLYVVMDYAEQNLGQLLQHRPLSEVETREMLPLILDALGFLHSRELVQGQLKPSNILVIENQLKLASDTIRPAGEATASIGMLSVYNPPEARDGSFSTSGDIWALGVTLCQTQRPPARSGERGESIALPTDFPVAFIDIVRRCLARNPAQRPSAADFQDWLKRGPAEPAAVAAEPPAPERTAPARTAGANPANNDGSTRLVIRAVLSSDPVPEAPPPERKSVVLPIVATVVLLAVCWAGVRFFMAHSNSSASGGDAVSTSASTAVRQADESSADSEAPESAPANSAAPGTAPSSPAASGRASASSATANSPPAVGSSRARSALPPAASNSSSSGGHSAPTHSTSTNSEPDSSPGVLHEELPAVSLRSRETIHGHVRVTVRVTVDKSGTVISDVLDNPGPSKYFARLAGDAASKWKFVPSDAQAPRQWLLHFEFSRTGTKAHADNSK
jgi:serine/threonine protein kinase